MMIDVVVLPVADRQHVIQLRAVVDLDDGRLAGLEAVGFPVEVQTGVGHAGEVDGPLATPVLPVSCKW